MPKNRKSSPAAPLWASQNDLTSARIIRRLIQKSNLTNADHVIEIGPGKGHITRSLPETCRHVTAVELDRALSLRLTEQFAGAENLTLRCADFCRTPLPKKGDYKVFANIPFSQTTDILRHLTECQNPPSDAYLILEKEAAKRFMGNAQETLRSLSRKPFFTLEILYPFRHEDFHPKPSMAIVMLHIARRATRICRPGWHGRTVIFSLKHSTHASGWRGFSPAVSFHRHSARRGLRTTRRLRRSAAYSGFACFDATRNRSCG